VVAAELTRPFDADGIVAAIFSYDQGQPS
jgi:hypothetical protein